MNHVKITKEDFEAYLKVQMSGDFNMLDTHAIRATGLTKAQYTDILLNYKKYYEQFKIEENA
jgi:hypothetical protein